MSLFDDNMKELKKRNADIYQSLIDYEDQGSVMVGDALNGEPFLAVKDGEGVLPLSSIYHPQHQAERFIQQFHKCEQLITILFFGFGAEQIIEEILEQKDIIGECIVYEPSIAILYSAFHTYDLHKVISDDRFVLFVENINGNQLHSYLDQRIDYLNCRYFLYQHMPQYQRLFAEREAELYAVYEKIRRHKQTEYNTMLYYAKKGSDNEIRSFKWLINAKSIYAMVPYITEEIPCIVVASGSSLEKNIHELKAAKGKSFIICVDSAADSMISNGIIPDAICTMDPDKQGIQWKQPEIRDIPIVVTPESKHEILESIDHPKVLYYSAGNAFHKRLFDKYHCDMPYFEGGGSVATNCFTLAAELGFRIIILVGQDLALYGGQIHAYKQDETIAWKKLEVEGYYGGSVETLSDYKLYLEYYEAAIPKYPDRMIINATEGGAKIHGAIQMPLEKAIQEHCKCPYDFAEIYNSIPDIWKDTQEKRQLYQDLKEHRSYMQGLKDHVDKAVIEFQRSLQLYQRHKLDEKKAETINLQTQKLISMIEEDDETMLLYRRMFKEELEFQRKLQEMSQKKGRERDEQLLKTMLDHAREVNKNIEEILQQWDIVFRYLDEEIYA